MLVNIGVRTNGCQEITLACTDGAARDWGIGKADAISPKTFGHGLDCGDADGGGKNDCGTFSEG